MALVFLLVWKAMTLTSFVSAWFRHTAYWFAGRATKECTFSKIEQLPKLTWWRWQLWLFVFSRAIGYSELLNGVICWTIAHKYLLDYMHDKRCLAFLPLAWGPLRWEGILDMIKIWIFEQGWFDWFWRRIMGSIKWFSKMTLTTDVIFLLA